MSPYESLVAAIVVVYALNFLFFPHSALKKSYDSSPKKDVHRAVIEPLAARSEKLEQPRDLGQVDSRPLEVASPREAVLTAKPLPVDAPKESAASLFERLRSGLAKTRTQLFKGLDDLFLSKDQKVRREEVVELLFETLIRCDVGVNTTEKLVEAVKTNLVGDALADVRVMKAALSAEMERLLVSVAGRDEKTVTVASLLEGRVESHSASDKGGGPHVVMVVGVNGVGKTTTTGKIAKALRDKGHPVVLGAADTFRAAAVDQLRIWAERSGAEFVTVKEGSDPASVAFEAVKRAVEIGTSAGETSKPRTVCLVDTAGRLHNRKDLMEELAKVRRVMGKNCEGAPHEVLLIVDATTGQNAIVQARTFREAVDINGLVLTKLDGTAKGGVALAIAGDLGLPIRFVGVGEGVEDLQAFEASRFIEALVGEPVLSASV